MRLGIASRRVAAIAGMVAAILISPGVSGNDSLTEEQGDAMLEELRQIRQVLEKMQQQAAPPPQARTAVQTTRAKASTSNRPALGADDAPITLVEFTDYQCPFCSRFFTGTLPGLKEEYIDTGKVRLVVKDLPLAMHARARPAAVAAHCAGDQDQFWAMHDTLFENNRQLQDENLKQYAQDIGLDTKRFQECLSSDRHDAMIDADVAEANGQGITGTPTFIVAETIDDVVEGTKIRGVQSLEALRRYFDALLKASEKPSG
jgi:protein-disulfide isomerase